ncbi:MAG: 4Fe-4S dicluster domain-containing protein [Bryobacterales bacterium]|nr:4Fe-4S dicluster domain-containing protein [Bryobacterales bacterium]
MDTSVNVRYRRVKVVESGKYPQPVTVAVSMACNHCENALCVKACPTHAMWRRDDGIVVVNQEACIGCQLCARFCPYGAPQLNATTGKTEKCHMCLDRVDEGLQPACATVCPTEALRWAPWDETRDQGSTVIPGYGPSSTSSPRYRVVTTGWGRKS